MPPITSCSRSARTTRLTASSPAITCRSARSRVGGSSKSRPEALTLLAAPGLYQFRAPVAPRPSGAAARDPRRSGGLGQRQVCRVRSVEERQYRRRQRACRCARTPAPRSSWARRASRSGPTATTRRHFRPASGAPIPRPICATARWRRCRCTRRSTPATILPAQIDLYRRAGRDIQIPLHRQGRRLGQQEFSVSSRRRRC